MNAETKKPDAPQTPDTPGTPAPAADSADGGKTHYHPIHPRMRVPYMIGGWLFVVFSLLVLFLRIVDPEPDKAGRTLLVIATTIFAGYLLYTANTEIRQVDSRHSGIQFWISLGAACGFVSLALCVAWVLARFITA